MKTTRRGGFSLAELMIAIGIMGVGITLVATIFPTALKQNEFSNNDTMGTLIAENGLAMAQALVHEANVASTALAVIADEATTTVIDANQQHYPTLPLADPSAAYAPYQGYVVLGRKADANANANDYQLVVVSYAKRAGGTVKAKQVNGLTISQDQVTPSSTDLVVGSPLILSDGRFAKIVDANASRAVLDSNALAGGSGPAYVIVEEISGNNAAKSPAIGTAVIETQLR